jgi:DtxR family Mn-dependent transcriptional regulator
MALRDLALRVPPSCRPGDNQKTKRNVTEIVEEYVEGIYRLQECGEEVTIGKLASYMCVSPGSASTMVKKLAKMGLARHTPYKSVQLTGKGERLAKQLTRTHRILKRFLVDVVGLPWNNVHELACKLEHYVSPEVIELIYEKLNRPKTCPHGSPIDPDEDDHTFQLSQTPPGVRVRLVKITNERYEFLRFLEEVGLLPGTLLTVKGKNDLMDLMHLQVGGRSLTIGPEITQHLWVHEAP